MWVTVVTVRCCHPPRSKPGTDRCAPQAADVSRAPAGLHTMHFTPLAQKRTYLRSGPDHPVCVQRSLEGRALPGLDATRPALSATTTATSPVVSLTFTHGSFERPSATDLHLVRDAPHADGLGVGPRWALRQGPSTMAPSPHCPATRGARSGSSTTEASVEFDGKPSTESPHNRTRPTTPLFVLRRYSSPHDAHRASGRTRPRR